MKLVCPRCQATFSVPDENAPGRDLRELKCAVCQEPMVVERESVHQGDEVTPLQLITASATKMLVCVADQALAERIARAVKGLEWQIVVAPAPGSALSQLENTQYDVVVLHERYGGSSLAGSPVLQYLQRLPMGLRRASLLCLLCEETPSLDAPGGFSCRREPGRQCARY